ncbi:sulfurtransferase [Phototrophicus methaneseepsis]|uniref:Sulfurtransferase n=1 Tax=Phototrophicus methaneseepsis TaxID=2710758 RepID=A0A7S8IH25_9CHLR|nr:sulfurtransferase [Phototrophicus methaneseepsis]QPC84868.1 sulfurtransferase [Phototrophicus methaneseepsis]
MADINERGYTSPDVLVSTEWVAENLNNENVRIVESNEDPLLYPSGHIPGAVEVDWTNDLNDPIVRDYIGKDAFEALASRIGITPETTVVFYGDKGNWWATYAFWVFNLFGHTNTKVMDGGRTKWVAEGRDLTRDVPTYSETEYKAPQDRDDKSIRALREDVLKHVQGKGQLVDVRSPAEYSGEKLHMEGYPQEGALRGGHIPGAKNIPWSRAANEDGTFKNAEELKAIYEDEQGLDPNKPTVSYCRIGERSSHSWFVLNYLLGFDNVRNYDGSWTEWGNSVGVPIEK